MNKNTFETRYKSFLERSFNQQNSDTSKRYILMVGFVVYMFQFYYFDKSFWAPISEGFVFYGILWFMYAGKTLDQKIMLKEDQILMFTRAIPAHAEDQYGVSAEKNSLEENQSLFEMLKGNIRGKKSFFSKNKLNLEKEWGKEKITKIPFDQVQSFSIIKNGIFSWKGMSFSYASDRKDSGNSQTSEYFYLDTSELTNLEYFIQRNKKYKDLVEKNSGKMGLEEVWKILPKNK